MTAILYANPGWDFSSGGQLRIWLPPGVSSSPHASSQSDSALQPQQLQHDQPTDTCQQEHLSTATMPASVQAGDNVAAQQEATEQQKAQQSAYSNGTAHTDASPQQAQQAGQDICHCQKATSSDKDSLKHAQHPDAASVHNQQNSTPTAGVSDSLPDFNHSESCHTE